MKKVEFVLNAAISLGIALIISGTPGGVVLLILAIGILSIIYFGLGFLFCFDFSFRKLLANNSKQTFSTLKIFGGIATGLSLSIILVGILFRILNYPGATVMLLVGVISLSALTIIAIFKKTKKSDRFYSTILYRAALYGIISLVILVIPTNTWLTWQYPNYPGYVKALIELRENPNDKEAQKKVEEERQKMFDQSHNEK